MTQLFFWLDILGTAVFAISGVLVAAKAGMDPFGAIILGVMTAVGGGTIRDIILDHGPIFWVTDSTDLVVAIVVSMISILFIRYTSFINYPKWILSSFDAVGLSVFVGIGVNKAIASDVNGLVAICMGVLTGVGGGVLRDVLAREVPMVFRVDIYATACIAGGMVHVSAYEYFGLDLENSMLLGMVTILTIRFLAICWHLQLPTVSAKHKQ